jgi:hypothetical protein
MLSQITLTHPPTAELNGLKIFNAFSGPEPALFAELL